MTEGQIKGLFYYKKKTMKCKTGPKGIISKRDSLEIKRYVAKGNKEGRKVNCRKIIEETKIPISRRALNSWLLDKDYKYSSVAQKIWLSDSHKKSRIEL